MIALGGIPNKAQVGDMGIDGRIYPVSALGPAGDGTTGVPGTTGVSPVAAGAETPALAPVEGLAPARGRAAGGPALPFMDVWYPIQVKQKDRAGRPDIDEFETAMNRAGRAKGFFVAFDYSGDALAEVQRFFTAEHKTIIPLTVKEILDEQIARKLA